VFAAGTAKNNAPLFGLRIIRVLPSFVEAFPRMSQNVFIVEQFTMVSGIISIMSPGKTFLHSPNDGSLPRFVQSSQAAI